VSAHGPAAGELATLILAAGRGTRFGGNKLGADVAGQFLLGRVLGQLAEAGCGKPLVVLGGHAGQLGPRLSGYATTLCPDYALGMGHSLAWGTEAVLRSGVPAGLLVVLGDQVGLNAADYRRLVDASEGGTRLAAALFMPAGARAPRLGAPAVFPGPMLSELRSLTGDRGARRLLEARRDEVAAVPLPNASVDIDTPEDLHSYLAGPHGA
jgi:CTP:molybdopterin cytidylyltransferase MocA